MLTTPFRGSTAVAAGLLTCGRLRGPRFRRLFRDVYVLSSVEVDLALLARAAHVAVHGVGVVGGWAAAELLGASCGPVDAPAEIIVPIRRRAQPRLLVRHEAIAAAETTLVGGVLVTDERRTAWDLGRRPPLLDAVIAIDALARVGEFTPVDLIRFGYDHLGAPGSRLLAAAVRLADPLSESPMETRIRMAIHDAGLPCPVLQHPVGPYRLDLAYPGLMLGIEYDGREHLTAERALRDLRREADLVRAGWFVLRFTAAEVVHRPRWVASVVRGELVRRGMIAA
jgi:very-short-patch-repair endonuclease